MADDESINISLLMARYKNDTAFVTEYVVDTLSQIFDSFEEISSIVVEVTKDRFADYPYHAGYDTDDLTVPFFDIDSQSNVYPLNNSIHSKTLKLDWETTTNGNSMHGIFQGNNDNESLMHVSTSHASFFMQGQCDQSVSEPGKEGYYENCTDANNNVFTGGVVRPTKTNYQLYRGSADLAFILKPLYEFHYRDVTLIGVYFANSGAGAYVEFPSKKISAISTYESIGCD